MSQPNSFDNSVRIHDLAVFNWLEGLLVDYGTAGGLFASARNGVPILLTFASPDRMYAGITETLVTRGWVDGATAADMRSKAGGVEALPLPIASIMAGDPVLDPELRLGVAQIFRGLSNDPLTGIPYIYQAPAHYRRDYTISFISGRQYTDNHIAEWVYSQFGVLGCHDNERLLPVVHASPYGTVRQSFRFLGVNNLTELEGENPRYVRKEYAFNLRMWVTRTSSVEWGEAP